MKQYNYLFKKFISWKNFYQGFLEAEKRKRFRHEILLVANRIDPIIKQIIFEIKQGIWKPHGYRQFIDITDTKRRLINAPAFVDRIVHHALVRVVGNFFNKKFISDSFANITNKGTHAAGYRLQSILYKERNKKMYALQVDIHHYFASISHDKLKAIIRRTIIDERILYVWDTIIDSFSNSAGKGIPIGLLVSQLSANVYLNVLDHYIKEELRVKYYIRYMDDFIILSEDKNELHYLLRVIKNYVETVLELNLNPKTKIYPVSQGVDFVGYRIWYNKKLPRKKNIRAAKKRLKKLINQYNKDKISLEKLTQTFASFYGYVRHCDGKTTLNSIRKLVKDNIKLHNGDKLIEIYDYE